MIVVFSREPTHLCSYFDVAVTNGSACAVTNQSGTRNHVDDSFNIMIRRD